MSRARPNPARHCRRTRSGLIKFAVLYGIVLALAFRELYALRRDRLREAEDGRDEREEDD